MIRYPRWQRKLQVVGLASLATLLLVSVALFGLGLHQLLHLGRPAAYRLNMLTAPEPNRQVLLDFHGLVSSVNWPAAR